MRLRAILDIVRALGVIAGVVVALPAAAVAQSPSAVIVVHVRAISGDAVSARVLVVGTEKDGSVQALVDRNGDARFVLAEGRYWVTVSADDFQTVREAVDAHSGAVRDLLVELSPLREIGRSRSRVSNSTEVASPSSVARRIAPNLAEALSSVAGVVATGSESGLGISVALNGDDEALTRYSAGGAPVPANAAALAVNTDLVQAVQVDQSREMVQFIGLGPTAAPVWNARFRAGSYGTALTSVSFQDTAGALGVAALHTLRAQESPLNGGVYLDTSGTVYRHVGALHATGDYLKLAAPLGTWAGSALFNASSVRATPLATYYAGGVPAGNGPGERIETTARNPVVALNGALAGTSLALTYAAYGTEMRDEQSPRIAAGQAFPFDLRERSNVETYSVSAERGLTADTVLSGGYQAFRETSSAEVNGSNGRVAHRLDEATVALHSAQRERGSWNAEYRIGRLDGRPYGSLAAALKRRIGPRLSIDVAGSAGTIAEQGNDLRAVRGWLEPYAADVDCGDRTIVTQGPGDEAATPRRVRLFGSAGWSGTAFHVAASAWYARTRDQLLSAALVPLRADDPSLPAGYTELLQAQAASPLRCGSAGPYAVFARRDVGGVATTNAGVALNGAFDRGRDHVEVAVELLSARLDAMNGAPSDPLSLYRLGASLPGIPRMRATVSYDRTVGARTELLASAHYESANNRYNLPPFVMTSVGVSRVLRPSLSLTVVGGNVFNDFAGTFVSPRYAAPVQTRSGASLHGVAAPLPPFRVSAQLDLRLAR